MSNELIYIAEDDASISEIVSSFLKNDGFSVECFATSDALLGFFLEMPADMVILDLAMSRCNGLEICTKIRENSNVPIIMISSVGGEIDCVTAMTLGCDDYLVKPFSPIELVARVKAIFRRINFAKASATIPNFLEYGDLSLDVNMRICQHNCKNLDLTPTEFEFLKYMFENSSRAISRDELLENLWQFDFDVCTRATDDVLKRLRKKLKPTTVRILPVWGFGFKLGLSDK